MTRKASKKMADKTYTTFPKMGTEAANARAAADYSPNLKFRPRGGASGGALEAATAGHRAGRQERLGATFAPQVLMSSPQAPEAGQNTRNTRLVPSAVGNRDFYLKRQYGQVMQ